MRYPIVSMSLSPVRKPFWSMSRILKFLCAPVPLLLTPPSNCSTYLLAVLRSLRPLTCLLRKSLKRRSSIWVALSLLGTVQRILPH
ncbi:hypothetical protein VTO42DRAFT_2565 [Malbranchea cinnamomea]